ncbi:MAG TPA: aldolase/citrate lyase family protein [Caulobacteraceae bacterium]|nr:aldolase/citrate lyase family protein [Caulobacteraceae bacterium]
MRTIQAREMLARGQVVLNGWSVIPGGFLAEVMASLGWDALTIDMQHGIIGQPDMVAMLQAISTTPLTPMVRLAANDPTLIGQALDAGAMGVICPLVNSPEDAARFVAACRYPPSGVRSSGATRAMIYAGFDYGRHADDQVLKFAMIETADGLARLDEIAATPGLDGLYVGPSDLSLALGGTQGFDKDEPVMLDAYARIVAACRGHGLVAGIHTASPAFAGRMAELGFRLVTLVGDFNFILAGRAAVNQARALIGSTTSPSTKA